MNPGKLDRRIQFLNSVSTPVGNDFVVTWVPVTELSNGETWAEVKPSSGKRQLEAGEPVIVEGTIFTTRYRRDFTPTKEMRISYQGRYYTIHGLRDIDDRRRFYEILTKVTDDNNGI